jgi:transposase, IS5 family
MRQIIAPQLKLGEQDIAAIQWDPKSRDDIPQLLRGLQHLYITPELRDQVFAILAEMIPDGVHGKANPNTGRSGMNQWTILVLGTLRRMLGHGGWAEDEHDRYALSTIQDNLRLFTPELLDRINQVVVGARHTLIKKPTRRSRSALTRSSSKPTSTIPRISIYCGMRSAS